MIGTNNAIIQILSLDLSRQDFLQKGGATGVSLYLLCNAMIYASLVSKNRAGKIDLADWYAAENSFLMFDQAPSVLAAVRSIMSESDGDRSGEDIAKAQSDP